MMDAVFTFKCRKCYHPVQIRSKGDESKGLLIGHFAVLEKKDCPCCGEEAYENWQFVGVRMVGQDKKSKNQV